MAKPVIHAVVKTTKIKANINGQWNMRFIIIISGKLAPAPAIVSEMTDPLRAYFAEHNFQPEVVNYLSGWLDEGLQDWDISRDGPAKPRMSPIIVSWRALHCVSLLADSLVCGDQRQDS